MGKIIFTRINLKGIRYLNNLDASKKTLLRNIKGTLKQRIYMTAKNSIYANSSASVLFFPHTSDFVIFDV